MAICERLEPALNEVFGGHDADSLLVGKDLGDWIAEFVLSSFAIEADRYVAVDEAFEELGGRQMGEQSRVCSFVNHWPKQSGLVSSSMDFKVAAARCESGRTSQKAAMTSKRQVD